MNYTIEFRKNKIKNKRGEDDFRRKKVKNLPSSHTVVAFSEKGEMFRRSINWDNASK